MNNRLRVATMALGVMAAGAAAQAQEPRTMAFAVVPDEPGQVVTFRASTAVEARITTGRPYSAEATTEVTQVLGDGNRIGRKETSRIYRDSDGRTRREQLAPDGSVRAISIYDPVAHVTYVLNPSTKTAQKSAVRVVLPDKVNASEADKRKIEEKLAAGHEYEAGVVVSGRIALVAPTEVPAPVSAGEAVRRTAEVTVRGREVPQPAARGAEEMKEESLGQKVIEGVMADGKRVTTTHPAGSIGNEQPLTVLSEQWFAPDLEILVMTRHSDPRWGHTTYTLSNIVRAEPQAGLFDLPSDYTVVGSGYMRSPSQR